MQTLLQKTISTQNKKSHHQAALYTLRKYIFESINWKSEN